jgi:hypothetical protein
MIIKERKASVFKFSVAVQSVSKCFLFKNVLTKQFKNKKKY